MTMGDMSLSILAFLPFIFWVGILILIIVLVVKQLKKQSGATNDVLFQKLADSIQLQQESLQQQHKLESELKEVKSRLISIEKVLKEVE